jgi:hypothetical protein
MPVTKQVAATIATEGTWASSASAAVPATISDRPIRIVGRNPNRR